MNILMILNSTWLQTVLLVAVGCITLYIYKKQRKDAIRDSAALIKLEIDSIENAFSKLKDTHNYEEIFQQNPIYQEIEWYRRRSLFISKMDIDYINSINEFYSKVIFIEEAHKVFKKSLTTNRLSKTESIQTDISLIIKEHIELLYKNKNEFFQTKSENNNENPNEIYKMILEKLDIFQKLYNDPKFSLDFQPNTYFTYYVTAVNNFTYISNTPAYEMLKKIGSNRKTNKKIFL